MGHPETRQEREGNACPDCGATARDDRGLLVHRPEYGCNDPEAEAYRRGYLAAMRRVRSRQV